jgi:hypothetical protein
MIRVKTYSESLVSWAAGSAPGITRIDNQIVVVPAEPYEREPPDEIC